VKLLTRSFLVALLVYLFSFSSLSAQEDSTLFYIDRDWNKIMEIVDTYYYRSVDHAQCHEQVLASRNFSSCLDKYSVYLSPLGWAMRQEGLNHNYFGVGMFIVGRQNRIHIFPIPNLPAARAGILPNDVLLKIDTLFVTQEQEINRSDLTRAHNLLRGDSGTTVLLLVKRREAVLPPIIIRRDRVVIPSVRQAMIAPGIGYISIDNFSDHVLSDFMIAFDSLRSEGAEHFIFDLRGNPGGYLNQALRMASLFADSAGALLVTLRYRLKEDTFRVRVRGVFAGTYPLILTDSNTASAAEIFGGVLQDWGVAKLVGGHTFGKGIGQLAMPLKRDANGEPAPGSSVMVLTNFHYLIGNRQTQINFGVGLRPDYVVNDSLSTEESALLKRELGSLDPRSLYLNPRLDASLRRALEILRQ